MNTTIQGRWRKKPLSPTFRSKEKLPSPVLPQLLRIRQTHLQQPHPPRTFPLSHLHLLLSRSNLILYGWTSFLSWPATTSWPVTSAKSVLKTICASIAVQETTSWTPIPRSRLWSLLKTAVLQQLLILQQLLLTNLWKNKEQFPGLCTDWGPHWTFLCSNEPNLTQCIHSFRSAFTLCRLLCHSAWFFLLFGPWIQLAHPTQSTDWLGKWVDKLLSIFAGKSHFFSCHGQHTIGISILFEHPSAIIRLRSFHTCIWDLCV